ETTISITSFDESSTTIRVNSSPRNVVEQRIVPRTFSIRPPTIPHPSRTGLRSRVLLTHLPALLLALAAAVVLSVGLHTTIEKQTAASAAKHESELALELGTAVAEVENAYRGLLLAASDEREEAYHQGVRQVWATYGEL